MSASPAVFAVYQKLLQSGELTVRVSGHQPLSQWERLARVVVRAGFGSDKLKIGALKGFADGSLGSTTALFFESYLDDQETAGLPSDEMFPESKMLDNIVKIADSKGLIGCFGGQKTCRKLLKSSGNYTLFLPFPLALFTQNPNIDRPFTRFRLTPNRAKFTFPPARPSSFLSSDVESRAKHSQDSNEKDVSHSVAIHIGETRNAKIRI